MLKLNLLPGSQRKQGTVQSAAITVVVIWLILLALLGVWALLLARQSNVSVVEAASQKQNVDMVDLLTKAQDAYKAEDAKIRPETAFMNDAALQPQQIATVMRDVARGTENGVVVENYTITPGNGSVQLTALALNAMAYNRARLRLYHDVDFLGVPTISAFVPGGGAATAAGASSAPAGPTPIGGPAAGASGAFFYPKNKYPFADTVTLGLKLKNQVATPGFSPTAAPAAAAAGGATTPGYPPAATGSGATPPPTSPPAPGK